jgi:protein-S-isoprenylcysteine O-methyltransferase Ste14
MTAEHEQSTSRESVTPPAYLLFAMLIMAVLHFLLPLRQLVAFPWRFAGIVPLVLGLTLNLAADRLLKQHRTTVKPFEKPTSLVTAGVYQVSGNPMYLGFVLILLGIAILMGFLSPFFIIPLFAMLIEVVFIRTEEHMMDVTFGETWLAYKAKVRRWI